ncbi:pyrroloquinoline quinone biosynthesis peptide chaperone PqqD [Thiohalorhabdus methylotrophus]|uniref:PqqA binding protein n=1 Tax=Thiohalorhabdus methylotrophus TaxID=3242694 RepID=A0ABV4TVT4_9GAMM
MGSDATFSADSVPVLRSGYRLQWEPAQEGYVLLYPEGMVTLNPSAAEILQRCDGSRTAGQLVQELQEAFPDNDVEPDVYEFLEAGHAHGWIQNRSSS